MAAEEGVPPVQWLEASQAEPTAEPIRAEPATVAATHTRRCRRADAGGGGLACRMALLERADDGLRCGAVLP
jgi:hypothetical protein